MIDDRWRLLEGNVESTLAQIPNESVHCCVTSPPYFGLRDYGNADQIGLEETPEAYVDRLVGVFREVRRVLRTDGTLWLNLGDSYATMGGRSAQGETSQRLGRSNVEAQMKRSSTKPPQGLKPKDLIGIPWMVAFALRADGWWLRSDIVWAKTAPMPESVTDRPTRSHEFVFLLTKSHSYHYDADSIREQSFTNDTRRPHGRGQSSVGGRPAAGARGEGPAVSVRTEEDASTRNKRSVWTLGPEPYAGAHFAVMPTALVRPCVRAGCPKDGTVLDPFGGSGTVGAVALEEGRRALLAELNPEYCAMIRKRLTAASAQQLLAI